MAIRAGAEALHIAVETSDLDKEKTALQSAAIIIAYSPIAEKYKKLPDALLYVGDALSIIGDVEYVNNFAASLATRILNSEESPDCTEALVVDFTGRHL